MKFYNLHPETESNELQKTEQPIFMFLYEDNDYAVPSPMHAHEYTEIFYITKGTGKLRFSNVAIPFKENNVFIIPKHTAHQELNITPKVGYLVVSVDNGYPFLEGVAPSTAPLHFSYESSDNELLRLMHRLREELNHVSRYQEYSINLLLSQVFVELLRQIPSESTLPPIANITTIYGYICNHYEEPISLQSLANLYYSSTVRMGKEFKRVYGMTPIRFLTITRVNRAKQMLKTTRETINNIASSCGFSSPAYFAAVFIRETGMSPTDYRKKNSYDFHHPIPAKPRR